MRPKSSSRLSTVSCLLLALLTGVFLYTRVSAPTHVAAAVPATLNFQARLLTGAGSIVPDGIYNVEFKLYNTSTSTGSSQGSCTGDATCLWTETRLTTDAASLQVNVRSGYLSVYLGDKTALPSNIWDQQIYLTMNIGGTPVSPTWDGQMTPRLRLTSVPYAFQAAKAAQLQQITGANTGNLAFNGVTTNPDIKLPDIAGTNSVLLQSGTTAFTQGSIPFTDSTGRLTQNNSNLFFDNTNIRLGVGTNLFGTNNRLIINPYSTIDNLATAQINTNVATNKGLVVQGFASQSADLLQLQDSTGNINAKFNSTGNQLALGRVAASGTVTQGSLLFADGTTDNFTATLQASTQTADTIFQLPAAAAGTYAVCTTASVCAGYGASATNGYVQLAPASAQVDSSTNSSIFINKTGASGKLLQLQVGGASRFEVNYGGDIYASGCLGFNLTCGAAKLEILTSGIGARINVSSTNDILQLQSGGTTVAVVNSAGSLGVGTATPTSTLQTQGAAGVSSGATTMTATNAATTFTTSVSMTLNAGDYIIPTTTSAQARSVVTTATGTTFTITPAFTAGVTAETFTIYRGVANLTNNSGTSALFVQGSTGNVGIGTTAPTKRLTVVTGGANSDIFLNDSSGAEVLSLNKAAGVNVFFNGTLNNDAAIRASNRNLFLGTQGNFSVNIATSGVQRLIVDGSGRVGIGTTVTTADLSLGGDVARTIKLEANTTNAAGGNLTIAAGAGGAGASAFTGGSLNLQGGSAGGTGNANGADVIIQGGNGVGTGIPGVVNIDTPVFTASATQTFASSGTITQSVVDGNSTIPLSATAANLTITLPAPGNTTVGRIIYITAISGSNSFTLSPSGGTSFVMAANSTATFVWNGAAWTNAGVDGGSSSYIQNQNASNQTADYRINGTGRANTSFISPLVDGISVALGGAASLGIGTSATNTTALSLGNTSATFTLESNATANLFTGATAHTIALGTGAAVQSITIGSTTGTSPVTLQSGTSGVLVKGANTTTAFQVQNAASAPVLTVDTTNSQLKVQGINSTASIGAELLTGNCTGTNWSGTGVGPYTHTSGSATALSCTITGNVISGATYQVSFDSTPSGAAATNITPAIGGVSGPKATGTVTTFVTTITTTSTANPTFTPNVSTDTGTISNISFKLVTLSNNVVVVQNSDASAGIELRAGGIGLNNSFVGVSAGQSNTTGASNTALGYQALQANTTVSNLTAIGYQALQNNTTGTSNTATGYQALQNNTSGFSNNANGNQALKFNTTGFNNTANGNNSLQFNTTGYSNTATGNTALYLNTTGFGNTASGYLSLYSNISGTFNTASGYGSLQSNTVGSRNTALGYNAGNFDPTVTSFVSGTALQNTTTLGYGSQVQASNSLILGGQGVNQVNVGIGTTIPTNTLSVSPYQYITGTITRTTGSTALTGTGTTFTAAMVGSEIIFADGYKSTVASFTNATSITMAATYAPATDASPVAYRIHYIGLQVTSVGNVGIGTATPTATFQAQGAAGVSSGATTMTAANAATTFTTSTSMTLNAGDYIIPTTTTGQARTVTTAATGTTFTVSQAFGAGVTAETFTIYKGITNITNQAGTSLLFVQGSTGRIGIGTVSPLTPLEVTGSLSVTNGPVLSTSGADGLIRPYAGGKIVISQQTGLDQVSLAVKSALSGQTADTLQVQDVNGNVSSRFSGNGAQLTLGNNTGSGTVRGALGLTDGTSDGFTATLQANTQTANTIFQLPAAAAGTYAVCTTASVCAGYGSSTGFSQGGNSFTAAGDLGTNDNFALNLRTNGSTKLTVSTAGDLTFAQGANRTLSVATNTTANGAGYNFNLAAGAADGTAAGNVGGVLGLTGGAAAGTGNNNGGNVTLDGGAKTGTGTKGNLVLQGTGGNVGIGTSTPAQLLDLAYGNLRFTTVTAPTAPTVAINATAGNLNGAYLYKVTFVTANGETELGTASASVSPASQQVNLTNIPLGTVGNVTSRKLYRTQAGGSAYFLLATIADNTTTTYTDNIADGSLISDYTNRNNTTSGALFVGTTQAGYLGTNLTSLGQGALASNTTGNSNTGVGALTLASNTTGVNNTALGYAALRLNVVGNSNVAIGLQALTNTTTSQNVAVGSTALQSNTSGSGNTALGFGAGYTATPANANISGTFNTFIGNNSGPGSTTQISNATALGYQALVSTSNSLVLGATGANAVNVGIGTASPTSVLHVVGTQPASGTATSVLTVVGGAGAATATAGNGANISLTAGAGGNGATANGNGGNVTLQSGAAGAGAGTAGSYGNLLLQTSGGNVGIGASTFGTNNKLLINPYSTVDNLATVQINTSATNNKGLVIQGVAGQTNNNLEIQNSAGTVNGGFGPNARIFTGTGSSFTGTQLSVQTDGVGVTGLGVRGFSGQTGDLLQLQDVNGNINAKFGALGNQLTLGRVAASGTVTQGSLLFADGTTDNFSATLQANTQTANTIFQLPAAAAGTYAVCTTASVCAGYGTATGSFVNNATSVQTSANYFVQGTTNTITAVVQGSPSQTAGNDIFQVQNAGGTSIFHITNTSNAGLAGSLAVGTTAGFGSGYFQVKNNNASTPSVVIRGAAGQTTDHLQLQDTNGAILSKLDANGGLITYGTNNTFGNLATPAFTTASSGSAYYYVITATNAAGETVASPSLGMINNTSALAWTQVNGATGYKIYRNTSNTFTAGSLLLTVITNGTTVSYNDTASATSAGLPPTSPTGSKLVVQAWGGQNANLLEVQNSAGSVFFRVTGTTDFISTATNNQVGGLRVGGSYGGTTGRLEVVTGATTKIGQIISGASGQTADLLQLQDNAGNVNSAFGPLGNQLTLGNNTATGTVRGALGLTDGTSDGFTATLQANTQTANTIFQLPAAAAGTYQVCTTASVCAGYGTATGSFVNFAPSSVQVDSSTNSSIFINKTGASGNILQLQKNGTDALLLNNAGQLGVGVSSFNNAGNKVQVNSITTSNAVNQAAQLLIGTNGAANSGIVVQGVASQGSGSRAFQLQSSAGTEIAAIDASSGTFFTSGIFQLNNVSATTGSFVKTAVVGSGTVNIYDVVVYSGTTGGNVQTTTTTTARDTRVYGVAISSSGPYTAGQIYSLAFTGNGQVNVDTGAVAIGDQLVTSSTAGQATVDNNATTGIIGIATSAKAGGSSGTVGLIIRPVGGQYSPTFRNAVDSTAAFQIQNAGGTNLLSIDSTVDAANLVTNPSFETNTTGWAAVGAASLAQSSSQSYFGTKSLAITTTAAVGDGAKFPVTLSPNTTYRLTFSAQYTSTGGNLKIGRSENGSTEVDCSTTNSVGIGSWTSASCNFTTGASISSSYIYIEQNDATARTMYIDGVRLVASATDLARYNDSRLSLNGVVTTPLEVRTPVATTRAFAVQNSLGKDLLVVNTNNQFVTANTHTIVNGGNLGVYNTGYTGAAPANLLSVNVPTTTDGLATALIATNVSTNKGLVIQGVSGQTANLFEIQDSNGVALAGLNTSVPNFFSSNGLSVGSTNTLNAAYFSVKSLGSAAANTVLRGAASQAGDLLQLQDVNGNINAKFGALGNQLTLGRVAASGTVTQGSLLFADGTTDNFSATLQANTQTANTIFQLPAAAAGTYAVCTTASVCAGYGTATGSFVNFAPSSVQADSSTNSSIFINKTGASGNILQLQNGGVDKLVVSNAGNVGIGVSSPTAALEVAANGSQTGTGTISSSGSTVTGSGTSFSTELHVGDSITASGQTRLIDSITNNTTLTIATGVNFSPVLSGASFTYNRPSQVISAPNSQTGLLIQTSGSAFAGNKVLSVSTTSGTGLFYVQNTGLTYANSSFVSGTGTFTTYGGQAASLTSSGASTTGSVTLQSGNASAGNSGGIVIDSGTASGTTGTISLGASNASAVSLGRTGVTTTNTGALTVTQLLTANGGLTVAGATNINTSGSAVTNIGTGTNSGAISIGNSGAALSLQGNGATAATNLVNFRVAGDTNDRLAIRADGQLGFGSGSGAADATLYRNNGGLLSVGGRLTVGLGTDSGSILALNALASSSTTLVLRGAASQTGDLLQTRDVNGAVLSKLDANGGLITYGTNNTFGNLTTPAFTTASSGSAYYYVITATNAVGETVASPSLGMANNTSALAWTVVNGATGYKIYRNTSNAFTTGSLLLNTFVNGTTVTYTDSGSATGVGLPPTAPSGAAQLVVQAWQNQNSAPLVVKSSTGSTIASIDENGTVHSAIFASVAPGQATLLSAADTGGFLINTKNDVSKGLSIRANSAGQSTNLFELQNSTGLANAAFSPLGNQLTLGRVAASGTVTQGSLAFADGTTSNFTATLQANTQTANTIFQLPAAAAGTYAVCTSANNCSGLAANINNTTTVQTNANFALQSAADASVTGLIKARVSQTADLLQFQNSAGTQPLSGINSSGQIYFRDSTSGFTSTISVTPGSLAASNKIVTLPNAGGELCTSSGNCIGNGGSGDVFKNGQTGPLVLGTNDAGGSNLSFITQNVTRATFDFANNLYLGNGATAGTPNNFVLQGTGSATAGTSGALFSIKGGAGATTTTGSAGGGLTLQGGDAGGSGANNGGNVVIDGGAKTSTGTVGNVILQATNGGTVGIGTSGTPAQLLSVGGTTGNFTVSSAGAVVGVGVNSGTGLLQGTGGLTITGTSSLAATTISSTLGVTGTSTLGAINTSGNFAQSGATTFSTGTGAVSLQGATTVSSNFSVTGAGNVSFLKGTDYTTVGSTNDVAFGAGALIRLTGVSAQTITGIAGGTDGRILTLVNAAAQAATLSNSSASSLAANRIITGTTADLTIPAGASVKLVYDATDSLWRVVGGVATTGGGANQQLSNLSGTVAINTALLTQGDNTIDLGSAANSFRTLYADTSVLSPTVDTATAVTLNLGTATASAISLGRTGITTTNNGALTVTQALTASSTLAVTGATTLSSTLAVTGTSTFTGAGTFNGGLTVANNSNFSQTGTGTFSTGTGAVTLNGATSVTGTNTFSVGTGATTLGGTLGVTGAISGATATNTINGLIINAGAVTAVGVNSGTGLLQGTGGLTITDNINLGSSAASTATSTIRIADTTDATGAQAVTIGSSAANTGNLTILQGGSNTTQAIQLLPNTAGGVLIGASAGTGTITLGQSTATNTINIGAAAGATNTQTINIGSSATATSNTNVVLGSSQGASTITLQSGTGGIVIPSTLAGTVNTSTYLCRNSTNQITTCLTTGTGAAFLQGGNSFTAAADLGTNDNFALNLRTNGSTKLTVSTAGDLTFAQGANRTLSIATNTTANGAGYNFNLAAGAADGTAAGNVGGVLGLTGGAAAGTGNNNGGNVTLDGGAKTGTGTKGNLVLQGGGGNVGIGIVTPTSTLQTQGAAGVSSGATTMTAANTATTFTTSVSMTLNAGDYIIPTTTTGQARSVVTTATGTTFTVTPAFTAGVTSETFTIHSGVANLTNSSGTSALFVQGNTGRIGIGTNTPSTKLDIFGGTGNGRIQADVSGTNPSLILSGDATNGFYPTIDFKPNASSTNGGAIQTNSAIGGLILYGRGSSGTPSLIVQPLSNAGQIGLVSRGFASQTGDLFQLQNSAGTVLSKFDANGVLGGTNGSGTNIAGSALTIAGGKGTGNAVGGSVLFQTSDAGATGSALQVLSTKATLTAAGNFGIGTTNPGAQLHVVGLNGTNAGTGTAGTAGLTVTGGAGGNSSTASTAGAIGGAITLTSGAGGNSTGVAGTNGANISLQGGAGGTGSVAGSYGNIVLQQTGGNVGIGTASPNEQLEITGNLRLPTATSTTGIIKVGANRFIHNYGTRNTFIGETAGNFTLTAVDNTAIGFGAGIGLSSGNANTLLGYAAGQSLSTGTGNVILGRGALSGAGAIGSSYNVVIGYGAGAANSANNNVFIGYSSGALTTGADNTFIGENTGNANTTGTANIFLGKRAGLTYSTTQSNQFIAGDTAAPINDVYFGRGREAAAPSAYTINGTGGLVGSSDLAGGALQFAGGRGTGTGAGGAITFLTAAAAGSTGTTQNTLTEKVRIDQNGRLGIGTTLPTGDLSFGGNVARTIKLEANTANAAGNNLTISAGAAGAGAAAFTGGTLTLQGGAAGGTGNANGADVSIQGGAGTGTGVQGLVTLASSSFTASATEASATSFTLAQSKVDNNSTIPVNATAASLTVTVPAPTQNVVGRLLYITAVNGSSTFTLAPSGGIAFTLAANTTATLIWNGTVWTNAGVDGGSSSYIQNQNASNQTADYRISGVGRASGFDINTTGTLNIGTGTTAGQLATAIQLGNDTNNSALTLSSGTGAISIGTGAQARTVNIATGGAVQGLTLGSTNTSSTTAINGGTGATAVTINTGSGGTLSLGNSGVANTIQIGNTTGAFLQNISLGTNATASSTNTINIGNAVTSTTNLNLGSTSANTTTALQGNTVSILGGTGASAVGINVGAAGTLSIGTTAVAQTINIGSTTTGSGIVERVGTGNYSLDGVAGSTYVLGASTTTGTINIGGTAQTGTLTLGQSTSGQVINIGNATVATGATQAVNIGTSATGTGVDNVTVGSSNAASTTIINTGTGGLSLGDNTNSKAINIGGVANNGTDTVNIATNATGADTITVGSTNVASIATFNGGAYNLNIRNTGVGINATAPTTGTVDLFFGAGARSVNVNQSAASTAGGSLTINAGKSGTGAVNGGDLVLQGGATGGTGTTGSVIVKANLTNSTTAFVVQQQDATALFTADTTNRLIKVGTGTPGITSATTGGLYVTNSIELAALGVLRLGDTTNAISFNDTAVTGGAAGKLRLSGTARNIRKSTLAPEYPGAVLTGDGTLNVGTMTSDFCINRTTAPVLSVNVANCGADESRNYYSWTALATNDYDIWTRWQVPSDFSTWDTTPITFYGWRTSASAGTSVTLTIYSESGVVCGTATPITNTNTWALTTYTSAGCSPAAGDILTFDVHLSVGVNNEFARIGDIKLSYLSNF